MATLALPRVSNAAADGEVTSVTDLLARIKGVPTFCIVNKDGASYMIVKVDERIAKGYAFTTFEGALAVLADAQRTAKEKGYPELWEDATITTIPADAAVRLTLTKKERTSQKDQSLDSIMMIIPSAVSLVILWCGLLAWRLYLLHGMIVITKLWLRFPLTVLIDLPCINSVYARV
jgi:hypothetical protein